MAPGSIQIRKYNDVNRSGQNDQNEPLLSGWSFTVTRGGSTVGTYTTGADGTVTVTSLAPGGYTVTEQMQAGWVSTSPGGAQPSLEVTVASQQTSLAVFGNAPVLVPSTVQAAGKIYVIKYNDLDRSGTRDAGEPGLGGVNFSVRDQNGSERQVTTGADGVAIADALPVGQYVVTETLQTGWTSTDPGGAAPSRTVLLESNDSVATATFGNAPVVLLPSTSSDGNAAAVGLWALAAAAAWFTMWRRLRRPIGR